MTETFFILPDPLDRAISSDELAAMETRGEIGSMVDVFGKDYMNKLMSNIVSVGASGPNPSQVNEHKA